MKKWLTGLLNALVPLCAAPRVLGLEITPQRICGVLLQQSDGETRVIHEFSLRRCRRDTPSQVQEILRMLPYRPLLIVVCGISPERMALESDDRVPASLWLPPGGSAGLALLQQQRGGVAVGHGRLPEFELLQQFGLRLPEHLPAMQLALQPLYRRRLLRAGLSRSDYRIWRLNQVLPVLRRCLTLALGIFLLSALLRYWNRLPEPLPPNAIPTQMTAFAPAGSQPDHGPSLTACSACTEHWRH